MICFYGIHHPLSNFFLSTIIYRGNMFLTSEHLYMWHKAMHFGDTDSARKILLATTPQEAKKLGRKCAFNAIEWDAIKDSVMYNVLTFKFTQNREIYQYLLNTDNHELIEASPRDYYWGAGASAEDLALQPYYLGKNRLGVLLMMLRGDIA